MIGNPYTHEETDYDQAVGNVEALHNGEVVEDLPGKNTRIALVLLHIHALAHADEALALQTAPCFPAWSAAKSRSSDR